MVEACLVLSKCKVSLQKLGLSLWSKTGEATEKFNYHHCRNLTKMSKQKLETFWGHDVELANSRACYCRGKRSDSENVILNSENET